MSYEARTFMRLGLSALGLSFVIGIVGCQRTESPTGFDSSANNSSANNSSANNSSANNSSTNNSSAMDSSSADSSLSASHNEFDRAILEVNFRLEADDNGQHGANGIPDSVEMALISRILATPDLDLSATQGVRESTVRFAWEQTYHSATEDIQSHLEQWPHLATLIAGYVLVGTPESFDAINRLSTSFGTPLEGDYTLARGLGKWLGPEGDADGDGFSNKAEYHAFGGVNRDDYLRAALDVTLIPTPEQLADLTAPTPTRFRVGIVLFDGFEVLDVYGPAEMWGNLHELELLTIAETAGPVRSTQGLATVATYSFADAPAFDILFVPGGHGTIQQLDNVAMIEFLQTRHKQVRISTSVCTGSALLAKAGILDGKKATSNKAFFELARGQSEQVQWVEKARWIEDGNVFTSSGVSAGIDMSLAVVQRLFGESRAKSLAEQLEYQWNNDSTNDPFFHLLKK